MIKKKAFFYSVFTVLIVFTGLSIYQLFISKKKHTVNSKPDVFIESGELIKTYLDNEKKADFMYTNKLIEVSGIIKNITYLNDRNTIFLTCDNSSSGIICDMNENQINKLTNLQRHQKVLIKGICKGFLKDVVLLDCYIDTEKTNE